VSMLGPCGARRHGLPMVDISDVPVTSLHHAPSPSCRRVPTTAMVQTTSLSALTVDVCHGGSLGHFTQLQWLLRWMHIARHATTAVARHCLVYGDDGSSYGPPCATVLQPAWWGVKHIPRGSGGWSRVVVVKLARGAPTSMAESTMVQRVVVARYMLNTFGYDSWRGRWSGWSLVACCCRWMKKMVVLLAGPSEGSEMGAHFAQGESFAQPCQCQQH
jgi:hypothetical protein